MPSAWQPRATPQCSASKNFGQSGWMSKHLVNGVMVGLVGHVFVAKSQCELPISQGVGFDSPAKSIKNLPEPF